MKFYEISVYQKSINRRGIGISRQTYFTSYEQALKEFERICEKYNAKENPFFQIDGRIAEKCRNETNSTGYASVSMRVMERPYYVLGGNIFEELREKY